MARKKSVKVDFEFRSHGGAVLRASDSTMRDKVDFVRITVGNKHLDVRVRDGDLSINASDPLVIIPNVTNDFALAFREIK